MIRSSQKGVRERRRAANVLLSCVAGGAVISNLAAPFAPRLPVGVWIVEIGLAGWLVACAWGSARRVRGWPGWSWAAGLLCVVWALVWALAYLKLRSNAWARWLAPGDLWAWFRWAPGAGAAAGALLMANALRVRGRG